MRELYDFQAVHDDMQKLGMDRESNMLKSRLNGVHGQGGLHGDMEKWIAALESLPCLNASSFQSDQAVVTIDSDIDPDSSTGSEIKRFLKRLMPWRKGPYLIHGIFIDTEWRSDMKWDRIIPHITALDGRRVLDVGCGNGYHCWRMHGAGAELVIGIDPMPLFLAQFRAVEHFIPESLPVHLLPLGIDDMPSELKCFDTVFSMGVLSHRRAPLEHLAQLKRMLRPGGELILETLVVNGDASTVLVPENRYARMRNVWFVPSAAALEIWLKRTGFTDVRTVDITATNTSEQRRTEWMTFESLEDFLDNDNPDLTVEGYPAPVRAVLICRNPS